MERMNLKLFRIKMKMTQQEFSEKIGYNRQTYANVETGKRDGGIYFWKDIKDAFSVSDEEIWKLMEREGESK